MSSEKDKELPIYLTLKEVAELLKVKPRTIYAWVSDKRIPYERKVVCCVFVSMQFSPGMSQLDSKKIRLQIRNDGSARARMPPLL